MIRFLSKVGRHLKSLVPAAKDSRRRGRPARPTQTRLFVEPLEDRMLLSTAMLVKDIKPGSFSSQPANLANVNGTLFFAARDATHGTELWKSDGTAAGTVLVKDINPGAGSSIFQTQRWTAINGKLFFTADDGSHGLELWKSDGTAAGTVMVKNINPGSAMSEPGFLTNVNGTLFFHANDGSHGKELWKSDGTAAGTVLVKDINPGSGSSRTRELTNVNGTLFFTAEDATHGAELWKSNGTAAGTVMVKDINPVMPGAVGSDPRGLTKVNGTLFFSADNGTSGRELWKSDGTAAGTVLVKDINPGSASSLWDLTNVNGTLFLSADNGTTGTELWKSDGTAAGTVLVKDINPGSGIGTDTLKSRSANVNGTLFFRADDGAHGWELWKSNGTAAGTVLVKDINPGSDSAHVLDLVNVGGTLFFSAVNGVSGGGLWKSDGTATGTLLVKDINPATDDLAPVELKNVNGVLFFRDNDGTHGWELWKVVNDIVVAGADAGSEPRVHVYDPLTGAEKFNFLAYSSTFTGGVRVATADVNGDGFADIITGKGAGSTPRVKVFDGRTGVQLPGPLGSFLAYGSGFTGGIFVAAGDVDGDGKADIITGKGSGGTPQVKVFSGASGAVLYSFDAYSAAFTGGVQVAAGDVNGDGKADIITAAGPGGGASQVKVFTNYTFTVTKILPPLWTLYSFVAFDASFTGAIYVAAGDVNGDGKADIVTGMGSGGRVRVFDGATAAVMADFVAYAPLPGFTGGVRVATADVNGDGRADIVTAPGAGYPPLVRAFDGLTLAELDIFFAIDPASDDGLFVAGGH